MEHEADPETVRAEAERLSRQMIFVPDAKLGEQLVPFFQERGWRVNRVAVMAQLREAERDGDPGLVKEVREEDLRPWPASSR